MQLGYINFSQEEKNNLYKVIQSIRDHHAIDELGIGRIRDAFSNKMFPGMSTLHNLLSFHICTIMLRKDDITLSERYAKGFLT